MRRLRHLLILGAGLCVLALLGGCAREEAAAPRIQEATYQYPGGETFTAAYTYDGAGRLTAIDGPDGKTTYTYDGEETTVTYPDGTAETYDGDLLQRTDYADGSAAVCSYDADGQLQATTYYDAAGQEAYTETYRYIGDDYGNVMERDAIVDGNEVGYIGYEHDLGMRVVKVTWYQPDESAIETVAYAYDDDGNIARETWYDGTSDLRYAITYTYEQ